MALSSASTCQCDSCYVPIIPKPKLRDRHHTAVLSSDFARRNTSPTTIIDKYGRPVIEGMGYWPADRGVLVADYEEIRLSQAVRRNTQGTEDGESYEQELLQDIQAWVPANKQELAFDVDIRPDDEKLAEQREQEERYRLAMERCFASIKKLSDEGGLEPGRYFNSIEDCDEETRRRFVISLNDCGMMCGSSEELDARRRTSALAGKLFDHFDPQSGDSEPTGPLEIPYEDPVYSFVFDPPTAAPPDKSLRRLSLVKAHAGSGRACFIWLNFSQVRQ
ncbi:unnamed protein product [Zymoseptoria tritici ST99CH_1E4]|uniref:Uncharacterized protein n=1 Tax=Zymoseptoria tritici ST99CH_1E4 TaxID=1276532 RepID=A0A2H1FP32_ZYMTR|nr:unnamed protein product [Zymoseptoria tritici ST99CH_1E4]